MVSSPGVPRFAPQGDRSVHHARMPTARTADLDHPQRDTEFPVPQQPKLNVARLMDTPEVSSCRWSLLSSMIWQTPCCSNGRRTEWARGFDPAAELCMQNVCDHLGGKRATHCSTLKYSIMRYDRWPNFMAGRRKWGTVPHQLHERKICEFAAS